MKCKFLIVEHLMILQYFRGKFMILDISTFERFVKTADALEKYPFYCAKSGTPAVDHSSSHSTVTTRFFFLVKPVPSDSSVAQRRKREFSEHHLNSVPRKPAVYEFESTWINGNIRISEDKYIPVCPFRCKVPADRRPEITVVADNLAWKPLRNTYR